MAKKEKELTPEQIAAQNEKRWSGNVQLHGEGYAIAKKAFKTNEPTTEQAIAVAAIIEGMEKRDYVAQLLSEGVEEAVKFGMPDVNTAVSCYNVNVEHGMERLAAIRKLFGIDGGIPNVPGESEEDLDERLETRARLVACILQSAFEDKMAVERITEAVRPYGGNISHEDAIALYEWVYGSVPDEDFEE